MTAEWSFPIRDAEYNTRPELTRQERTAIEDALDRGGRISSKKANSSAALARFREPIRNVVDAYRPDSKDSFWHLYSYSLRQMYETDRSFFGWSADDWFRVADNALTHEHLPVVALAYYLNLCDGILEREMCHTRFAQNVFGRAAIIAADEKINENLKSIGYGAKGRTCEKNGRWYSHTKKAVSYFLLKGRSPFLKDIPSGVPEAAFLNENVPKSLRKFIPRIVKALRLDGHKCPELANRDGIDITESYKGISEEWRNWVKRWLKTTTLASSTRDNMVRNVLRTGYWLNEEHPHITSPEQWDADLCLAFRSMTLELKAGQYTCGKTNYHVGNERELTAASKLAFLHSVRRYFNDLQKWNWIESVFNSRLVLSCPIKIRNRIQPDPRDIDEKLWLKLVWASLNLEEEDMPESYQRGHWTAYPIEYVKALAVVWTHTALRSDEIRRLELDAIRSQDDDMVDEETDQEYPAGTLCYLTVPINKTSKSFVKPVPGVVKEFTDAWKQVRREQPPFKDRRTKQPTHYLFANKGRKLGESYINRSLIPMLCKKAGIETSDARGNITSHRARATHVTLLANSKAGMPLHALMKWCGHKNPQTTLSYLRLRPAKLAESYARADQMTHMIKVLIDQEAVTDGTAASGGPWKYYDLGNSYCTNVFWSTCDHRMACAGCSFNVPKASSKGQAIAAKTFLNTYLEKVPLSREETAMVKGDIKKIDAMLAKLKDVPAPDGTLSGNLQSVQGRAQTTLIPLNVLNPDELP